MQSHNALHDYYYTTTDLVMNIPKYFCWFQCCDTAAAMLLMLLPLRMLMQLLLML